MDLRLEKKRREDFLVALWAMHAGNYGGDRPTREVCERIGIDYDTDGSKVGQHLRGEGLVTWGSFDWISLTVEGRREAERIVAERHAETEIKVLRKIYDLSQQNTAKPIFLQQLESELRMGWQEVTGFVKGLDQRGLINWPPDVEAYLYITREGIDAIESSGKPKQSAGGDTYNLNIQSMTGGVQQGSGNSQSIQINQVNNPEFDKAIVALIELIRTSELPHEEIQELQEEVTRLNRLALSEAKPGLLEKAKARIEVIKVGLQGTEILIKATPLLQIAWDHFSKYFQ